MPSKLHLQNANSLSDVMARQAMKLIYGHIRKAFANGEDSAARAQMLEGSLLAAWPSPTPA